MVSAFPGCQLRTKPDTVNRQMVVQTFSDVSKIWLAGVDSLAYSAVDCQLEACSRMHWDIGKRSGSPPEVLSCPNSYEENVLVALVP
jgi:hypothetical protein